MEIDTGIRALFDTPRRILETETLSFLDLLENASITAITRCERVLGKFSERKTKVEAESIDGRRSMLIVRFVDFIRYRS